MKWNIKTVVFTLTKSDNGGLCDCMCPYDLVYQMTQVPPGAYPLLLSVFSTPIPMDLSEAVEGWFCIDRLLNAMYNPGQGTRGSFCQNSSECMSGNGYCFTYPNDSSVCVNTCTTTEDCPMPTLEECTEDASGIGYCAPTTSFDP